MAEKYFTHEKDEKDLGYAAFWMRTSENAQNANFAMKLSEKSHERANLLAVRRLIAT